MEKHKTKYSSIVDRFFKDKGGKVVLWQAPNGPLLLWIFMEVLVAFVAHGKFKTLCTDIAFAALFTWAWLEISSGVTYFRRTIGVIVLIVSIMGRIK